MHSYFPSFQKEYYFTCAKCFNAFCSFSLVCHACVGACVAGLTLAAMEQLLEEHARVSTNLDKCTYLFISLHFDHPCEFGLNFRGLS